MAENTKIEWADLDNCDYYNADEFTHWRPLPKPPTNKGAPDA